MSDYFDSGFTVREPSWHRKETVHADYPKDWNEAREWAGLTWNPVAEPVFKRVTDDDGTVHYVEDDGFRRLVRNDTMDTLSYRPVSWQPIDHDEMGWFMEALLGQGLKYETAGSVQGGKIVWALVYLDEPYQLPGDPSLTLPFVVVTVHHDGTGSLNAASTNIRVVCFNTISAAESQGKQHGTLVTIRHSKNWRDRVEDAKQTIAGLRDDTAAFREMAETLSHVKFDKSMSEEFIQRFVPLPEGDIVSDRVVNNVEKARDLIRTILAGPTSEGIADSAWGHVMAAGEYLDHFRRYNSPDSYVSRTILRPEALKHKTIRLAREIAAV